MEGDVPLHFNKNDLSLLSQELKDVFVNNGLTLAVAESFTGGTVCGSIVSVSGASTYFVDGVVCYSHEAKIERLGVDKTTIDSFGAVSQQTALEMVRGLMRSPLSPSVALATTGNAGPGREDNSVDGEAYIAISYNNEEKVIRLCLDEGREENIFCGACVALRELINFVKNQER